MQQRHSSQSHCHIPSSTRSSHSLQHYTSSDALTDALLALCQGCSTLKNNRSSQVSKFLSKYNPICQQLTQSRVGKHDFEIVKSLAKGQHGKVFVVRSKLDNEVYAMKVINKNHVLKTHETAFLMEEQLVLSHPNADEWIPSLYASFQDNDNLYLVMEYAGGGDLFSILDRKENLRLSEDEARFYIAETILAVNSLHKLGFVHRDIKPQNVLIDAAGHVKLADFGSSIHIDACTKTPPMTAVGTCDYVSPEVLQAQHGSITYGTEVDWWSIGIVLYEMLQEFPPFYSEQSEIETYRKILCHESSLHFNEAIPISENAKDLIQRLLSSRDKRLGKGGLDEIMNHPFFDGIDWNTIRSQTPPFQPTLSSPDDTSNFSVHDDEAPLDTLEESHGQVPSHSHFDERHLAFIGYTFSNKTISNKDDDETAATDALNRQIEQLQAENAALAQQLEKATAESNHKPTRQHEDEARIAELEQRLEQEVTRRNKADAERDAMKNKLDLEKTSRQRADNLIRMIKGQLKTQKDNAIQQRNNQEQVASVAAAAAATAAEKRLEALQEAHKVQVEKLEQEVSHERQLRQSLDAKSVKTTAAMERLRNDLEEAVSRLESQGKQEKHLPPLPNDIHSPPGVGRSIILSTMWKRDRESLRCAQEKLETSEGELAHAKREVTRLRKQVKCLRQYTFETSATADKHEERPQRRLSFSKHVTSPMFMHFPSIIDNKGLAQTKKGLCRQ